MTPVPFLINVQQRHEFTSHAEQSSSARYSFLHRVFVSSFLLFQLRFEFFFRFLSIILVIGE